MVTGQIEVTGMVLSSSPVGEYDRRLVIMTKEVGKITAFAKGARRPNSNLLAATQPFVFGKFEIFIGKKYTTIHSANISKYFSELRDDFNKVSYGLYFLELTDYYVREEQKDIEVLKLLYQSMRALLNDNVSDELVKCVFELKMVSYSGELGCVTECVNCRKKEDLYGFSFAKCGMVCNSCMEGDFTIMRLSSTMIYVIQYILYSSIEKLYSFKINDEVLKEFENFNKRYFDTFIDRRFKALEILNIM